MQHKPEMHGMTGTPEYDAYLHAKKRCTNSKRTDYYRYGGRGIEFRFTSFKQFFAEVGPKPSPLHSLDRYPNNKGHYEPGNVRWATPKEQSDNRNLKWITCPCGCKHRFQIKESL